ncbi:MAG: GTPase HflX [Desulfobacterales bacterium]
MKKPFGTRKGLKKSQIKRLENLYRRRIPPEYPVTPEVAREISLLSHEIHRQVGLLINRRGKIEYVIIGSYYDIFIPETPEYRSAPGRLSGLRCVHTHPDHGALSRDDLTDLALLRLDLMAAIAVNPNGEPDKVHIAHVIPTNFDNTAYEVLPPIRTPDLNIGCMAIIRALESELAVSRPAQPGGRRKEFALLISVTEAPKSEAAASMDELKELAKSSGIKVVGSVIQHRRKADPKFVLGSGKIKELTILALQKGASMLIFDQELSPGQIRSITDQVEIKVIDRTQLILDIFAQQARSREGKLQVELAQLKYLLPRLVTKNTAMSRLTGGIGGRGPGETKLEINRRRARERITHLEKSLEKVRSNRRMQRSKRKKKKLPIISIIGYTNAGKSTLLNTLTDSRIRAEDRLFATLDPSSRRLRFPRDLEVIITDTVGFIKDLPEDLRVAFRATLEELENADLLLHVIDISNPRFKEQMTSVNCILDDLNLNDIHIIPVLNKMDLVDSSTVELLRERIGGVPVSAIEASTLEPLVDRIQDYLGEAALAVGFEQ